MPDLAPNPTLPGATALFTAFFRAGLLGFGGVLPMIRRVIVEERAWLTPAEFNELLALCQFLPGANVANLAVVYGSRCCGPRGSLAGLAGLLVAPMAIVLVIGAGYDRYGDLPAVRHLVTGLSAGGAAAFAALGLLRLPLLPSLCVLAPASIALAGWRLRP
jgi:chromate transporter